MTQPHHNVILTGIPRSGTTLACHLLNRLPDTVALHEPMAVRELADIAGEHEKIALIADFFSAQRRSLLHHSQAASKVVNGRIPDNPWEEADQPGGVRRAVGERGMVRFDKRLSEEFLLAIKHPVAFTAMLQSLSAEFRCYALIRNPLAVLASWNTADAEFRHGHAPQGEKLNPRLAVVLSREPNPMLRQIRLLAWFYRQYAEYLPPANVIRYEDMVASGGKALAVIDEAARTLDENLKPRNTSSRYIGEQVAVVGDNLLAAEGAFWRFYSREEVANLQNHFRSSRTGVGPGR